jgi:hypothetical protein
VVQPVVALMNTKYYLKLHLNYFINILYMINYCKDCYDKTFKNDEEYRIRLAEAVFKKETLLCYHTYSMKISNNSKHKII